MTAIQLRRLVGLAMTTLLFTGVADGKANMHQQKPVHGAKKAKFAKLRLLRPPEVARLSNSDRLKYYNSLHKILVVLDSKPERPGKRSKTNALTDFLIPEAFAADKVKNKPCLIGGYFGSWQQKGDSLSCSQPDANQTWEDKVNHSFLCGKTDSGEQKAFCNSAFFLYASDKHDRICAPMTNFTENCNAAFQKRYGSDSSLLQKDTANLMLAMGKEEIDLYHQRADDYLNYMLESEDPDAPSAQILSDQLGIINGIRTYATKTYENLAKEPSLHPGLIAKPVDPAKPDDPASKSDHTYEKPPEKAAEKPDVKAPAADSALLGKELSCVHNGLANAGYSPSEKYIAFIAAGVQASRGPWNSAKDDSSRHNLQSAVISTIQAYGFCSENSYPSTNLDSDDIVKMRRLITADNGAAMGSGPEYFDQALLTDDGLRQTSLYHLFGMRGQAGAGWLYTGYKKTSALDAGYAWTFPNEVTWQHDAINERQRIMTDLKVQPGTAPMPFESCQKDIKDQASKKGGAYDLEVLSISSRRTLGADPEAMKQVTAANFAICKSMADACQLNVDDTCKVKGYVQGASGPIKGTGGPSAPEGHREPPAPGPNSSMPTVR